MPIDIASFETPQTGDMATKFVAIDAGEYIAMIPQGGVADSMRDVTIENEIRYSLDINWEISAEDPKFEAVKEKTGMARPRVRQSILCEVVMKDGRPFAFASGPGRNVQLGRLREAVGQLDPKKPWTPKHLEGVAARIKVEHRLNDGEKYAQVAKKDGVAKL